MSKRRKTHGCYKVLYLPTFFINKRHVLMFSLDNWIYKIVSDIIFGILFMLHFFIICYFNSDLDMIIKKVTIKREYLLWMSTPCHSNHYIKGQFMPQNGPYPCCWVRGISPIPRKAEEDRNGGKGVLYNIKTCTSPPIDFNYIIDILQV